MRETIFRGKSKDGRWNYGNLLHLVCEVRGEVTTDIVKIHPIKVNGADWPVAVDPETVGQDTGMKDKRGRKIFDGDILKFCYPELNIPPTVGKVYYSTKDGGWIISYHGGVLGPDVLDEDTAESAEIIGNITDNPELMDNNV